MKSPATVGFCRESANTTETKTKLTTEDKKEIDSNLIREKQTPGADVKAIESNHGEKGGVVEKRIILENNQGICDIN